MNFSDELHKLTNDASNKEPAPTHFQLVLNAFRWDFQEKCKKLAENGHNSLDTIFRGSYDIGYNDVMVWKTVTYFTCYDDAIPYRDATIEIIKEFGFVNYKVEIEQCEMHTKGLFCNGIGYFLKQLFDRDYYIKIHVEW